MKDQLKGGSADNMSLKDIAKKQSHNGDVKKGEKSLGKEIKLGIPDEMEHTSKKGVAKEIAKDHLVKDPKFYSKEKKMETKEQTDAGSSGSFEAPAFSITKREIYNIHNSKPQEVNEVTSGDSGQYDVPFGDGGKNPLKINGVKSIKNSRAVKDKKFPKWGGPGGVFVKVNEKCKKFPYCNQGDPKALEFYEIEGMKQAVIESAKKYGLTIDEVEKIVLNEIKQIFI